MMYEYKQLQAIITPAQQAASLRHRRAMLRELWWHRRRPALAAFARLRAGAGGLPLAGASIPAGGSGTAVL